MSRINGAKRKIATAEFNNGLWVNTTTSSLKRVRQDEQLDSVREVLLWTRFWWVLGVVCAMVIIIMENFVDETISSRRSVFWKRDGEVDNQVCWNEIYQSKGNNQGFKERGDNISP